MNPLFKAPVLSKVKTLCQCLQHTACNAIKYVFLLSFRQISDTFSDLILTLLKLFVCKEKEIFEGDLKNLIPFTFGEGIFKVFSCKRCHFWGHIEEGTEPQRKYSLEVWSKPTLGLLDKGCKCQVGCLSYFFIRLVHYDAAEVIEEESQKILDFVWSWLRSRDVLAHHWLIEGRCSCIKWINVAF